MLFVGGDTYTVVVHRVMSLSALDTRWRHAPTFLLTVHVNETADSNLSVHWRRRGHGCDRSDSSWIRQRPSCCRLQPADVSFRHRSCHCRPASTTLSRFHRSKSLDLHRRRHFSEISYCEDLVNLFCGATTASEHPSISVQIRAHSVLSVWTTAIWHCLEKTGIPTYFVQWLQSATMNVVARLISSSMRREHHSSSSSTWLAETAEGIELSWPSLHTNVCIIIRRRWFSSTSRLWCPSASEISHIVISGRLPRATVYCRRPSIFCRCCSCLEQSATAHHFCSFIADTVFPLTVCRVLSKWLHLSNSTLYT